MHIRYNTLGSYGNMREINYGDDGYSYDYLKESILNETNLKKED